MSLIHLSIHRIIIFLLGALSNFAAISETVEVPPSAAEPYSEDPVDEKLEPEITIIRKKDSVHEEYRINGKLYMVKVIPYLGPPYFYIDQDGDGTLERKSTSRDSDELVPQWVIFKW